MTLNGDFSDQLMKTFIGYQLLVDNFQTEDHVCLGMEDQVYFSKSTLINKLNLLEMLFPSFYLHCETFFHCGR